MREGSHMLTQEELRNWLSYDPETGIFRWIRKPSRSIVVGQMAGHPDDAGYVRIKLNKKSYLAHRLAWLYMTGEWPERLVDHRDCTPINNRWKNLRQADDGQNSHNQRARRNNRSGAKGISWIPRLEKWRARITVDCKERHLGVYECIEDAIKATIAARCELHGEFANHGT